MLMICQTHLHFIHFSLVTLSQLVTPYLVAFRQHEPCVFLWICDVCCPAGQCFVTAMKVHVVPNTAGRREDAYRRVL